VTSLSIMRLIPSPPGKIVGGQILFDGENLVDYNESEMRKIRGNRISMIFQDPMTSLNPVLRIGRQMTESLQLHMNMTPKQARNRATELLSMVGIPAPEKRLDDYPHQFSGGMRQRVMIAMGLSCNPELLIADEPTTALDVTIQAQILELLNRLKNETGTAIILITHDLGVIAEMAENVMVMYAGKAVEYAPVGSLFEAPKHPYTQGLIASTPILGVVKDELATIPGQVPSLLNPPAGCRFAPRCAYRMDQCTQEEPPLIKLEGDRLVRCWLY
jgi:oligopeptide/dipeptide ABC transporter ATP-binding protein